MGSQYPTTGASKSYQHALPTAGNATTSPCMYDVDTTQTGNRQRRGRARHVSLGRVSLGQINAILIKK